MILFHRQKSPASSPAEEKERWDEPHSISYVREEWNLAMKAWNYHHTSRASMSMPSFLWDYFHITFHYYNELLLLSVQNDVSLYDVFIHIPNVLWPSSPSIIAFTCLLEGEIQCQLSFCGCPDFFSTVCGRSCLFSMCVLCTMAIAIWIYLQDFYSTGLCVCRPVPWYLYYYSSLM